MRSGVMIHGILLLVALIFGYQGTTQEVERKPNRGTYTVWNHGALGSLSMASNDKLLEIVFRPDKNRSYFWGKIQGAPMVATSSVSEESTSVISKEEMSMPTREFPLGAEGEDLMQNFENLVALRDLGVASAEVLDTYNLKEKTMALHLTFADHSEAKLVISGQTIYGGSDRYALDVETAKVFVLSGKIIKPLISAEHSLSLRDAHYFREEKIEAVEVQTRVGTRRLLKSHTQGGVENRGEDTQGKKVIWKAADTSDQERTYANFIDRVASLGPMEFEPSLQKESLIFLVSIRYLDKADTALGFIDLYKKDRTGPGSASSRRVQYFIKTEATQVFAQVNRMSAQRVEQYLEEMFGSSEAVESKVPDSAP